VRGTAGDPDVENEDVEAEDVEAEDVECEDVEDEAGDAVSTKGSEFSGAGGMSMGPYSKISDVWRFFCA